MHIAIIGNGISGTTAARFIRKNSDYKISLISSESTHFYSRTALMYIYMGHMKFEHTKPYEDFFWKKNRIDLVHDHVNKINFDTKSLSMRSGKEINYDKLILATGSATNKFGWPGQDLKGVGGLYSLQDLATMDAYSKNLNRAVIVGGGLIGIEMAEMFHSRNIPVSFLVREKSYWNGVLPPEESEMINREIIHNHIDLRLGTELKEIKDDGTGTCKSVLTNHGDQIECGFVGLTAGVHPNIRWIQDGSLEMQKGILVDSKLETNIPGVYAIGDCAQIREPQPGRRSIEAVWYTGRMMGETVGHTITGKETNYDPGIWFNSAKFFDIEYQVYGDVRAEQPENHDSLFWQDDFGKRSVRILWDKRSHQVVGFNLFGIRFRHEVCERWLSDKTHIDEVLQNLRLANFDPEFYEKIEPEVIRKYNSKTGKQLGLKGQGKLNSVLSFLKMKKNV